MTVCVTLEGDDDCRDVGVGAVKVLAVVNVGGLQSFTTTDQSLLQMQKGPPRVNRVQSKRRGKHDYLQCLRVRQNAFRFTIS